MAYSHRGGFIQVNVPVMVFKLDQAFYVLLFQGITFIPTLRSERLELRKLDEVKMLNVNQGQWISYCGPTPTGGGWLISLLCLGYIESCMYCGVRRMR